MQIESTLQQELEKFNWRESKIEPIEFNYCIDSDIYHHINKYDEEFTAYKATYNITYKNQQYFIIAYNGLLYRTSERENYYAIGKTLKEAQDDFEKFNNREYQELRDDLDSLFYSLEESLDNYIDYQWDDIYKIVSIKVKNPSVEQFKNIENMIDDIVKYCKSESIKIEKG